jgi:hypothetical protein
MRKEVWQTAGLLKQLVTTILWVKEINNRDEFSFGQIPVRLLQAA